METTTEERQAPWRHGDGSMKSDATISGLGRGWDQETWDGFLDEDVGTVESDERLGFTPYIDMALDESDEEAPTDAKTVGFDPETVCGHAMDGLTAKERGVVEALFWEGLTSTEAAAESGVSPSTVRATKRRALGKLKRILKSAGFRRGVMAKLNAIAKKTGGSTHHDRPFLWKKPETFREKMLEIIDGGTGLLSGEERRAVDCLYRKGTTFATAAAILNISRNRLVDVRDSAFHKLKNFYTEGYEENKKKYGRTVGQGGCA